jgi:hypothetical protein
VSTVEIRLQLLKDVGAGFSKHETVKHLIDRFRISRSAAYYHFKTKDRWLKDYADFSDSRNLLFQVLTQLNYVNREASYQYLQTADPNAKIGFLRVRLDALGKLAEYSVIPELTRDLEEIKRTIGERR